MSPVSMVRSSRTAPTVRSFKSYSDFCHAISKLPSTPTASIFRYWSKSMTFHLGIKPESHGLLHLTGEFTQFSPLTRRRSVDVQVFRGSARVTFGSVLAVFSAGGWKYYRILDNQSPYARSYSLYPVSEGESATLSGVSHPKHLINFLVAIESLCSSL